MPTSILQKRRATLGLWCAAAIVILIGVVSAAYWRRTAEESRWIRHSRVVSQQIIWLLDDLRHAETQERAYLVTGQPGFLRAYTITEATLIPHVLFLSAYVRNDASQHTQAEQLHSLIQQQIEAMHAAVTLRQSGADMSQARIDADAGSSLLLRAFTTARAMDEDERKLLDQHEDQTARATLALLGVVIASSLLMFVLVAGSAIRLQRDLDRRILLEQELRTGREELLERQEQVQALNVRLRRAMAETHHRVKNNLQIISALTEMQAEDDEHPVPASALHRVRNHVQTLATVHDILTRGARESGEVEMLQTREALDKLGPLLATIVGDRHIVFNVDELELPIRQGTSLVVLINELVSNAAKHGAGDIVLGLRAVGDQAELTVRDDGPGFPQGFDPKRHASTGLELIDSLGRWDLGGDISFCNNPGGGACVTVTFPLKAAPTAAG
jgi:two-component sensor histidine kinase